MQFLSGTQNKMLTEKSTPVLQNNHREPINTWGDVYTTKEQNMEIKTKFHTNRHWWNSHTSADDSTVAEDPERLKLPYFLVEKGNAASTWEIYCCFFMMQSNQHTPWLFYYGVLFIYNGILFVV